MFVKIILVVLIILFLILIFLNNSKSWSFMSYETFQAEDYDDFNEYEEEETKSSSKKVNESFYSSYSNLDDNFKEISMECYEEYKFNESSGTNTLSNIYELISITNNSTYNVCKKNCKNNSECDAILFQTPDTSTTTTTNTPSVAVEGTYILYKKKDPETPNLKEEGVNIIQDSNSNWCLKIKNQ